MAGLILLTGGCGGGGGSGGAPPVQLPPNAAPVFTSPDAFSIAENQPVVTTLAASDADGDALTFTLAGGADGSLFTVSGTQLRFLVAPDADAPGDANKDNVYELLVSASDGKASVQQPVRVSVANSAEGVAVRRIGNVGEPFVGAALLKGGSIKLASRHAIHGYDPASNTMTPQLRWSAAARSGEFLSITAARSSNFVEPYMLVSTRLTNGRVEVWHVWGREAGERGFEAASLGPSPIYSLPFDPAVTEVGGKLGECMSGRSCIAFGSLGVPADATSSHYGSVVEFEPNPNPYSGASVGPFWLAPAVTGSGLRLPMALAHDVDERGYPLSLLIDRGASRWDEVVRGMNSTPSPHYGWPWREGLDELQAGGPPGLRSPELVIARGNGFRQAEGLTSLVFYKGANPSLAGKLLLADRSGRIFAVPIAALDNGAPNQVRRIEDRTADFRPDSGTIDGIAAMLSVGGELLLLDRDGDLFVMEG